MGRSTSDSDARPKIEWPGGKSFAFTVFDDPDYQTRENTGAVYEFLADCGFRTTKGVFPGFPGVAEANRSFTCQDAGYVDWALDLKARGFEMGWHGAAPGTSTRQETQAAFDTFRELFGAWPVTGSQHFENAESLYWGDQRLSGGFRRRMYNLLTRWKHHGAFHGQTPGHKLFWGDLCGERLTYLRNFVFTGINTLAMCPPMPYHDPDRPYVNRWYASTLGHNVGTFIEAVSEKNQDQLEAERGACIMYTHFAYFFQDRDGRLEPRFRRLMERLSRKNGWFVPVGTLLDYIADKRGAESATIGGPARRALERRWLMQKVLTGNT